MKPISSFIRRRAVLISGGIDFFQNHDRYLNDLKSFYSCLVGPRYGFLASEIEILYANGGVHRVGMHHVGMSHTFTAKPATAANAQQALRDESGREDG